MVLAKLPGACAWTGGQRCNLLLMLTKTKLFRGSAHQKPESRMLCKKVPVAFEGIVLMWL